MSAEPARYLDASALVKLAILEPESRALGAHVDARLPITSSALSYVEVVRAVRRHGADAVRRARAVLENVAMIAVGEPLLHVAADLEDPLLRSLDAVHVAAALSLEDDLAELITYDGRMASAARALGLPVVAPA